MGGAWAEGRTAARAGAAAAVPATLAMPRNAGGEARAGAAAQLGRRRFCIAREDRAALSLPRRAAAMAAVIIKSNNASGHPPDMRSTVAYFAGRACAV